MRGDRRTGTARRLRRDSTDAERKLWARLRDRQLDGLKFKRQAPIGRYVADFVCPEHHLIVEVDGEQHGFDANVRRDTERTARLEAMGYVVLRFWNLDVLKNMDGVLTDILHQLHRLEPTLSNPDDSPEPPHPVPLPPGERERSVDFGTHSPPSAQTSKHAAMTDKATSPRPEGERDRMRGDRPERASAPSRGDSHA